MVKLSNIASSTGASGVPGASIVGRPGVNPFGPIGATAMAAPAGAIEFHQPDTDPENDPNILILSVDKALKWARSNSVWPLAFGLACCAIEMFATLGPHYDLSRFGSEVFRASPRQADLMIVPGTVTKKMAPRVRKLWDQMPEPKWAIAMGACATCGGPYQNSYSTVLGVDKVIPVDVYIPGCPPRPEALIDGLMRLQEKIRSDPRISQGLEKYLK